ncbi:zona pellucida sperm-binding protein 4-like [Anabas testudineus]|uniref:ZP domain-containing protein n=1 Tax=Anabas testudineus TaxID=64144 RepID=A0A3Q1JMS0_ANATE|nr:zona pellucida sperm-binding protein 4-like [Anabas testudineus]
MAGLRVGLLVVLTGTLLLDSAWCLTKLWNLHGNELWAEPLGPAYDKDLEYVDEKIPEDEIPEPKGEATSDGEATADGGDFHSPGQSRFPTKGGDSSPRNWDSGLDGGSQVEFGNAPPRTWTGGASPKSPWLNVVCSTTGFKITLLTGQLSNLNVLGADHLLPVMEGESCGYEVNPVNNILTIPFTGCNVKQATNYVLQLLYISKFGQIQVATASCPQAVPPWGITPSAPTRDPVTFTASQKAQNCSVSQSEQVRCGRPGISANACEMRGCCVNPFTSACYYPLDECTVDYHIIFAVRYNSASVPVDPTNLFIPGSNCKPVLVNDKVAIYKFRVTECGVRAYDIGYTKIFMVEVQTLVSTLELKFGAITRTAPLKFTIECRYNQRGANNQLLASTGYMVKTPSSVLPSTLVSNGLYGVQLRLATNQTYSTYFPNDHPPLRLLLGNPVYVELNLMSPNPAAVILVNYCVAYPLSAKNALVLIYEGCANPNAPNVAVLKASGIPQNPNQRRFVVTAFQFMDQRTNRYLDEEIYFMCSTEVCRPTEKICVHQCFDG